MIGLPLLGSPFYIDITLLLRSGYIKYQKKEGIGILIIRKQDAEYLREHGFDWAIVHGHGTYKKYYLVEHPASIKFLEKHLDDIREKSK